jgi:DNA-binding MarR family transcriptional regulator
MTKPVQPARPSALRPAVADPFAATAAADASVIGNGADPAVDPALDSAVETSRLLLELLHVAYANRGAGAGATREGPGGHGGSSTSTHAMRAAIHVHQHGTRTIGELAAGLGISYGWASRIVAELEASGMVRRSDDPHDRRVVNVSLTDEATQTLADVYRWRRDAVARALGPLDAAGRDAVTVFLRRITDELGGTGHDRRPPAAS